jgi:hypothetical protein
VSHRPEPRHEWKVRAGVWLVVGCISALTLAASPVQERATVRVSSQDRNGVTIQLRVPQSAVDLGLDPDGSGRLFIRGLQLVWARGRP